MTRGTRLDAAGLELTLALPSEAQAVAPPAVDLGVAPGFSLAAAQAWRWPEGEAQAICVTAEAWFWAPGLEGPVLDAASALARKTLALPTLAPDAIRPGSGPPFEQNYRGAATTGRHWLGFRGDRVVVCSLSCGGDSLACARLRDDATMTSEAAPPPGVILAAATDLAARPRATALGAALIAVGVAALVLWRRPRPELS